MSNRNKITDGQESCDIESQLSQLNETVSSIQQRLDEEQRMLQSGRLGIGIIIVSMFPWGAAAFLNMAINDCR